MAPVWLDPWPPVGMCLLPAQLPLLQLFKAGCCCVPHSGQVMEWMEVTETFASISLPGHLHTQESLSFVVTFPFHPTNMVIATYPKSGEGWWGRGTGMGPRWMWGSVGQGWGPPGWAGGHGQALLHSPWLASSTRSCLRAWEVAGLGASPSPGKTPPGPHSPAATGPLWAQCRGPPAPDMGPFPKTHCPVGGGSYPLSCLSPVLSPAPSWCQWWGLWGSHMALPCATLCCAEPCRAKSCHAEPSNVELG